MPFRVVAGLRVFFFRSFRSLTQIRVSLSVVSALSVHSTLRAMRLPQNPCAAQMELVALKSRDLPSLVKSLGWTKLFSPGPLFVSAIRAQICLR